MATVFESKFEILFFNALRSL